ncbi:hypothetical protein Rxycam_03102 [Rubrobacter xylanophilus DSM 9941]|nr:hypothetical protein Rxycam_03102 [Rubrobacter xylanophilus DSM 9941]
MLQETGRPRRPADYFQRSNDPGVWELLDDPEFRYVFGDDRRPANEPTWAEIWGVSRFEEFLDRTIAEATTPNGVFGTKIMWAYFRDFVRLARRSRRAWQVSPCGVPAAVFPNLRRYVWIRRRDTVRQAVSLWRALQSWRWRQDDEEEDEEEGVRLRFSFAAIDHLKLRIDEHNAAWRNFFRGCGVEPVEVVYEDFVRDYEGTVVRVVRELGIPTPEGVRVVRPRMRRQSDGLSEEWARRYLEIRGAVSAGGER